MWWENVRVCRLHFLSVPLWLSGMGCGVGDGEKLPPQGSGRGHDFHLFEVLCWPVGKSPNYCLPFCFDAAPEGDLWDPSPRPLCCLAGGTVKEEGHSPEWAALWSVPQLWSAAPGLPPGPLDGSLLSKGLALGV